MEEKIITVLDNLSRNQIETLLEENVEMKISGKDRHRIKNAVLEKIGQPKPRIPFGIYIPKKIVACIVAFAIVFASIPIIGFDKVYAAISRIFTFVPGEGVVENNNTPIYMINPITRQIQLNTLKATIVNALYKDDYLSMQILVDGRPFYDSNIGKLVFYDNLTYNDFKLYINGNLTNYNEEQSAKLSRDSDGVILSFSCKATIPTLDDIYEIEITGFPKRLSCAFTLCRDYTDVLEIGPLDTQNGISIAAITDRIGNQLVVWCYPLNTTTDALMRYGCSQYGYYSNSYIATESSLIFTNESRLMSNRLAFDMPENYQNATLHIPYLAMSRNEIHDVSVKLPQGYSTVACNISINCSLGTIIITEIKRTPLGDGTGNDRIDLKIALVSNDKNIVFDAFDYHVRDWEFISGMSLNAEGGTEGISIWVGENEDWVSFTISALYYRLLGEYVIPLDFQ
ncbi:MAG: hypothetical protein FWC25_02740 [Dehalococcoidia bacterium]|nr:hypothetical protein [Dehalococcoidia bacterium]